MNIDKKISTLSPIWGWPNGWLGILEFAPLKLSSSIPSSANFSGQVHIELCSGFKWDPRK